MFGTYSQNVAALAAKLFQGRNLSNMGLVNLPDFLNAGANSWTNVRSFRVGSIQEHSRGRALALIVSDIVRHPTDIPYAWKVGSILELGKNPRAGINSPICLDSPAIRRRITEIEAYPERYGANFLDVYYDEFVTCQNGVENKWTTESIIEEVFHGTMVHTGPICIGKMVMGGIRYLIVGHDKCHFGGRAATADHRSVIGALKTEAFDRVVFWVDTPGADSGANANATHQAACMSELITAVCTLEKPSVTVLAGEGGSGGAEVFFGTDLRIALERSYFSTIHPIGHSAIGKGKRSPKEIAWLLGVDSFHLAER